MKLNFKKTLLAASIAGTLLAGQALAADPSYVFFQEETIDDPSAARPAPSPSSLGAR
mgnify:CR=1 FL=1